MREKDTTNGVHLNKHIYFQPNMHVYGQRYGYAAMHANNAHIQSCNEWGKGQDVSKTELPPSIYYVQSLIDSST